MPGGVLHNWINLNHRFIVMVVLGLDDFVAILEPPSISLYGGFASPDGVQYPL